DLVEIAETIEVLRILRAPRPILKRSLKTSSVAQYVLIPPQDVQSRPDGGDMKSVSFLRATLLVTSAALVATLALGANCKAMVRLNLPNAKIDSAQIVAAGAFTPPPPPRVAAAPGANGVAPEGRGRAGGAPANPPPNPYKSLPAFCRVTITSKP